MLETKLIIIDDWQFEPFSVPIGKRIKRTATNSNNEVFYFKEPEQKYPWEFWTEIAASKIGQLLGFDIVDYNIGVFLANVGCISKSMVSENDELIHGQQFLTQINPRFDKKRGTDHTFQLLEQLFLTDRYLKQCWSKVLEMVIFDAVIGNRDRHQQNWAVIRQSEVVDEDDVWYFSLRNVLTFWKRKRGPTYFIREQNVFSPLFDNGNCLAYNITNDSVMKFLGNDQLLEHYVFGSKATSHIRWQNNLITHFELVEKILYTYKHTKKIIKKVLDKYDKEKMKSVIFELDKNFDNNIFPDHILIEARKELMVRIVELRMNKLIGIINAG